MASTPTVVVWAVNTTNPTTKTITISTSEAHSHTTRIVSHRHGRSLLLFRGVRHQISSPTLKGYLVFWSPTLSTLTLPQAHLRLVGSLTVYLLTALCLHHFPRTSPHPLPFPSWNPFHSPMAPMTSVTITRDRVLAALTPVAASWEPMTITNTAYNRSKNLFISPLPPFHVGHSSMYLFVFLGLSPCSIHLSSYLLSIIILLCYILYLPLILSSMLSFHLPSIIVVFVCSAFCVITFQ